MARLNIPREIRYRPCMAADKKAIFHRWAVDEEVLIKFSAVIKDNHLDTISRVIRENRIVPQGAETEKLTNTYGIVEFETGEVKAVRPCDIRFLDSEGLFREYDWSDNHAR